MERDHLDRLVDDPARVRRDDLVDLKSMTERYPWFSGAHLLLAVGEHAAGDVLFEEQLRVTAAHLPSRAVLFDRAGRSAEEEGGVVIRLDRGPLPVKPLVPKEDVPARPAPDPPIVELKAVVAEPIAPEPLTIVVPQETPIVPPTPEPLETVATTPQAEEADPLDVQMREAALAGGFALTWAEEVSAPLAPPQPVPEVITPAAAQAPPSTPPPAVITGTRKFSQWLDLGEPQPAAPLPSGTRLDQLAAAPDATDWVRGSQEKTAAPQRLERTPPQELVEAKLVEGFLRQAPLEQKTKAEFFDPQKAAKRSLQDHADLVTETLARIYEKQGNIAKAIAAYERLAVKHPERSDYFRGLARALEGR